MNRPDIPVDPLAFIRDCVARRQIIWTYRVNMRLTARGIGRDAIIGSLPAYEVIECYPDDKYLPSYLVLAAGTDALHILFAVDVAGGNVRIAAYRPKPSEWEPGLRKRKQP
jgi:hypothetical protein